MPDLSFLACRLFCSTYPELAHPECLLAPVLLSPQKVEASRHAVAIEDRDEIEAVLAHSRIGLDFADVLHLAASKS